MLRILKILAILGAIPVGLLIGFFFWGSAGSYPKDQYNQIVNYQPPAVPAANNPDSPNNPDFTVVSYNIGYLSGLANAAGPSRLEPTQALFEANLQTAVAALAAERIDLIGLQEIDLASKRSFQVNQVDALAKALGFRAAAIGITWDKPLCPDCGRTGYFKPLSHHPKRADRLRKGGQPAVLLPGLLSRPGGAGGPD
jgi:hypothetical protein